MKIRMLFVATLVVATAFAGAPAGAAAAQTGTRAKNVILLIGDGMGPSHFGAAWLYSNRILNRDLRMSELMKKGHAAYLVNDTADAIVTESAAAAGQIATGQRMTARAISMAADGKTPVRTIMEMAKARKMATGLVTTSGITDATPAAFAAHVAKRSDEDMVAEQEIKFGVDVLMGGRRQFFVPESAGGKRKDGRNLVDEAKAAGYTVVGTAEEMRMAAPGRLLGLFNMGNMTYEMDRGATSEPSLVEMTRKTLHILSQHRNGFFAMIEGGRIDHAAHRNDAAATIQEVLAFDAAVGAAMDFAKKVPGTLVIVTADHETGGMALIGNSKTSSEYVGIDLSAMQRVKRSFQAMEDQWGKQPTPAKIKEAVRDAMGIELTDDEATMVVNDPIRKADPQNYSYQYLHTLAFVLRPYIRVGWGSQTHTASPLYLFGDGPGAHRIAGLMHNTEVFTVVQKALRLD